MTWKIINNRQLARVTLSRFFYSITGITPCPVYSGLLSSPSPLLEPNSPNSSSLLLRIIPKIYPSSLPWNTTQKGSGNGEGLRHSVTVPSTAFKNIRKNVGIIPNIDTREKGGSVI